MSSSKALRKAWFVLSAGGKICEPYMAQIPAPRSIH
jgi:hypothetical protein